jgi:autotransporter-associated beta strand protein
VVFVQSHDDFGPDMMNVAYAFSLMRPGNALVYYNAYEHYDPNRTFPKPGRGDALGNFGNTITTLVDLRNRYGRGDYRERYIEKENYAFERSNAALVMLSNRNDSGYDSRTVSVEFALGARLVELTGNAARANATMGVGTIPEVVEVVGTSSNRYVNARFLRNNGKDQGYLVYGLPTPKSSAGIEFSGSGVGPVIAGDTPPTFQGGETTAQTTAIQIANATSRLADMQVITGNSFSVRLATQAVTLSGGYRDRSADGDTAMIRINEGLDLNGSGAVDVTTPGDVSYGFENFTTTRVTGYSQSNGNGLYEQAINASLLPEGMNFLTVRAYRQRSDGGPAVYSEFKDVLYVDRLKPESVVDQYVPFSGGTGNNDVWIKSTDGTADRVNIFQNIPATVSDATILAWVNAGQGATDKIDRDIFKTGFFSVPNGNNTYTVVTREITGNTTIQRITGRTPASGRGLGLGDLNYDGVRNAGDMTGTTYGFERVLYSKNAEFNAGADATGDGLVDTYDLLQLEGILTGSANSAASTALAGVKFRRVNFVNDSAANEADLAVLRAYVALPGDADTWTYDLDVDGAIDDGDVQMAQQRFGVAPTAGVPATLSWTGNDGAVGGSGTWATAGLAWRGAVTDASLAMPLVPGSKATFSGVGVVATVSGSVLASGGLDFRTTGLATITGAGTIVLGGSGSAGREVAVADGSHALLGTRVVSTGGLTKTGPGRLTLSASTAIGGSVVISAGTVALGNGGATGSVEGTVRVDAGGVLAINRNNRVLLSTPISGSGGFVQMGSGSTVMSVANSYSGATGVQAGILRVEHASALASSPTTVSGGRLDVADGLVAEIAGLSVAGGVVEINAGGLSIAAGGITSDSLVAALGAGRGDGSWTGASGIRSSAAASFVAAGESREVGWVERPNGSFFVAVAAPGDANVDGAVDILDVSNFLVSGKFDSGLPAVWEEGDFGSDGLIDILDAAAFMNTGLFDAGFYNPSSSSAVGVASVPEPTTLGLAGMIALGGVVATRRHRRKETHS